MVSRGPGEQRRQHAVPGAPGSTTESGQSPLGAVSSQAPASTGSGSPSAVGAGSQQPSIVESRERVSPAAGMQGAAAVAHHTRSRAPLVAAHDRVTTRQHVMLSSAGGDKPPTTGDSPPASWIWMPHQYAAECPAGGHHPVTSPGSATSINTSGPWTCNNSQPPIPAAFARLR